MRSTQTTRKHSAVFAVRSAAGGPMRQASGVVTVSALPSRCSEGAERCGTRFPRGDGVQVAGTSGAGLHVFAAPVHRCMKTGTRRPASDRQDLPAFVSGTIG